MKTNSTARNHPKSYKLRITKGPLVKGVVKTFKVIRGIAIVGVIGLAVLHFTGTSLKGAIDYVRTKTGISGSENPVEGSTNETTNPVESSTNETLDYYRENSMTRKTSIPAVTPNTKNKSSEVQTIVIEHNTTNSINNEIMEHYKNASASKSDVVINETLTTGSSTTKDGETKVKVTVAADEQGKVTTTIEELSLGKDAKNNNTITDVMTTKITADTNIKDLNPISESQKFMFTFAKKTATELSDATKDGETQMALQTVFSALLANWGNLSSKEQEALGAENTSVEIASVKRSSSVTIGAGAQYENGFAIFDGAINYNIVDKKTGNDLVLISGKFAIDQYGNYAGSALGVSGRITKNVIGYLSANHNLVEGFSGSAGFRISFGKDDNTPALIEAGLHPAVKPQEDTPSTPTPSSDIQYENPNFVDNQRTDNVNLDTGSNAGGGSNLGGNGSAGGNTNQNTNQNYTNNNTPNQMNRQSNDNLALN